MLYKKLLSPRIGGQNGSDEAGFFCTVALLAVGRKPGFELVVLLHQRGVRAQGIAKVQKELKLRPLRHHLQRHVHVCARRQQHAQSRRAQRVGFDDIACGLQSLNSLSVRLRGDQHADVQVAFGYCARNGGRAYVF